MLIYVIQSFIWLSNTHMHTFSPIKNGNEKKIDEMSKEWWRDDWLRYAWKFLKLPGSSGNLKDHWIRRKQCRNMID